MCILGHWALLLNTGKPVDSGDEGLRLVSLHKNACNIHLPEAYGVVGNHGCMYIYIICIYLDLNQLFNRLHFECK